MGCYAIIPYPNISTGRIYFSSPLFDEEAYYHASEIICLVMLIRVVFIIRGIFIQSQWFKNRTQRVCHLYACEANYMFVVKSLMRTEPYTLIFTAMAGLILVFGYAIRICESPLNRIDPTLLNYQNYFNSMWNIIITISTVGYGDLYARTIPGKIIIFFVCIFGVFVVSLMVVTLTNSLMTTSLENKAIVVLQRIEMKKQIIESAGTVLTIMAKLGLNRKKTTNQMSVED